MRILILGSTGIIGTFLLNFLKHSRGGNSTNHSIKGAGKEDFSLLNINDIKEFISKEPTFDILIFLVGLAHAKGKGKDLPDFKKINFQTLSNLCSALEDNKKAPDKIIFSSTISVYGEKYHQSIYSEDSIKSPFSPYAITKLDAEQYLLDNFADKTWILRFAPVYSTEFLLNINRRTQIRDWFYRIGQGSSKLSLCNIENIGIAIDAIINKKVPSGIYNLSDPKEYTYNELLRWYKANWIFPIPMFVVNLLYHLGKFVNSTFLKENTIKLISDNIYPSDKICSHIDLPATIYDV